MPEAAIKRTAIAPQPSCSSEASGTDRGPALWAASAAPDSRPNIEYYPAFDYLRMVLATLVAAGHAGVVTWKDAGNFSVQVFFALSGWLIGAILLKAEPRDLPRFYFNRGARIWIPYFLAIALLMSASLLKDHVTPKWLEIFFYNTTFSYNFFGPPQLALFHDAMPLQATGNHFWSICAEEQFYLLAPFLITMLPGRIGNRVFFWIAVAVAALTSVYWNYFGSISLGVLAAVSAKRVGNWHSTRRAHWALGALALVGSIATYFDLMAYRIIAPISAIALVLFFAQAGPPSKIAAFLGGVSYPMYLNHWIGAFAANLLFGRIGLRDSMICKGSGVILGVIVAAGLYLVVDQPVRKKRDHYFTKQRGKIFAVTGLALVSIGIVGGLLFRR